MAKSKDKPAYRTIISHIFSKHFRRGMTEFEFDRDEIEAAAKKTRVSKPRNLGDVVYYFRHRQPLPDDILKSQPAGMHWLILGAGDARYRFRLSKLC